MLRVFAIPVLVIMALFGSVKTVEVAAIQAAPDLDWYLQAVDQALQNGTMSNHSLRIDSSGHPHIAYEARGYLYHAWYDATVWHFETVDTLVGSGSAYPFLVLDHSDQPHIAYRNGQKIEYAYQTGGMWQIQTVDSGEVDAPQLALDKTDQPHVVYSINNVPQLSGYIYAVKYATWASNAWHIQTVEEGINTSSNYTVFGTSIAVDAFGYPQLSYALNYLPASYSACVKYCVKYVQWTGSAWTTQIVEQGDSSGTPVSASLSDLVLDETDHPHLIFGRRVGGALYAIYLLYAARTGNNWTVQSISVGNPGGTSLAVDSNGNPNISFNSYWTGIQYAHWTGSTWAFESVDDVLAGATSFALDTQNGAHIAYFTQSGTMSPTLKYARQLPALVLSKDAFPKNNVAISDTVTYTLTFSGPAGHTVQLLDPLSENVTYVSGSVTLPAVYSFTLRAIIWQGTLLTDTLSTISFQVTLTSTVNVSLSTPSIVNTAWLTDTEYDKAIQATTIVNGSYLYLPLLMR